MIPKNTPTTKDLSPDWINAQKFMYKMKMSEVSKELPSNLIHLMVNGAPLNQLFRETHKMYKAKTLKPEVRTKLKMWMEGYRPTEAPSTKPQEKPGKQLSTAQTKPQNLSSSTTMPSKSFSPVLSPSSAIRTQILTQLLARTPPSSKPQKIKRYKMSSKARELLQPWERAAAGDLNALDELSPGFRDEAIKVALRKIDKEYATTPVSKRPYPEEIRNPDELKRLRREMVFEDKPLPSKSTTAQGQL